MTKDKEQNGETKAEFKAKDERTIEIAKNGILEGFENEIIQKMTKLTIEQIEKLREEL